MIALSAFLATIVMAVRGGFTYPVELAILAMLGILLIASLVPKKDDAAASLTLMLLFLAVIANVAYLYSVAGYLNLARLGTLGLALIGFFISGSSMLTQPVPPGLTLEAKRLIAAEKSLSAARERLEAVKESIPARARKGKRTANPKRRKR